MHRKTWSQWIITGLVIVVAITCSLTLASAARPATAKTTAIVKTCPSGYKHAVIGGVQKCLKAGNFCTHSLDKQYRKYGFRCIHYDSKSHRYRLTKA
jgi:hypothetical protein